MSYTSGYEFRFGFGREGVTYYVHLLILLNVAVYAVQLILDIPFGNLIVADPPGGSEVLRFTAYSNDRLLSGWVWTPVTYMFLHGSLWHLFWNLVQLFIFGPDVERVLGTRQFIRFYIFCGVAGAFANLLPLALGWPSIPVVGASGAILGVLVAFVVIDPDRQLFLIPLPFPITARALIIFLIAMNVLAVMTDSPVAVATHVGGMIAGYAYMKLRPRMLQWTWQRRGRRARKGKPESSEDEEKLAEAIDNIFKFQDRDR